MQFTILSVFAALVATSMAIPVPDVNHPATAEVLFLGAANALFPQEFTTDGHYTAINNNLSVSKISTPLGVTCTFHGIDGSVTKVGSQEVVDVGPPQTQIAGACWGLE